MKKVIVIGAGGHGRVTAEIVQAAGDEFVGFLDDAAEIALGKIADYDRFPDCELIAAIGNAAVRERIAETVHGSWYTAVHPTAVISPTAVIGEGTVVMPNAVVNAGAQVGRHVILNTGSIVEHDDRIADFAHISVGAKLGGTVTVGRSSWIGIGASVINNVTVCENCMIGAGAAVIRSITEPGTYVGVPAVRLLRKE